MPVSLKVEGEETLRAAANRLRVADEKLPAGLRKLIREAARTITKEQKSRVRSMSVKGSAGSTGLRRTVARGVTFQLRTGGSGGKGAIARIRTKMPSNLAFAPRGFDTSFSGWRAPLFGDRSRWYRHGGSDRWFMGPTETNGPKVQADIVKLLNATVEEIRRALS